MSRYRGLRARGYDCGRGAFAVGAVGVVRWLRKWEIEGGRFLSRGCGSVATADENSRVSLLNCAISLSALF